MTNVLDVSNSSVGEPGAFVVLLATFLSENEMTGKDEGFDFDTVGVRVKKHFNGFPRASDSFGSHRDEEEYGLWAGLGLEWEESVLLAELRLDALVLKLGLWLSDA